MNAVDVAAAAVGGGEVTQEGPQHKVRGKEEDHTGLSLIANAIASASSNESNVHGTPVSNVPTAFVTPAHAPHNEGQGPAASFANSPMRSANLNANSGAVPMNPNGGGSSSASASASAMPYQSPPSDAHSFLHYPPSAPSAPHNPNPNQNPQSHLQHPPSHAPPGPSDHQQQQWRYYNPRDTPQYPPTAHVHPPHGHGHGHGHGHAPPTPLTHTLAYSRSGPPPPRVSHLNYPMNNHNPPPPPMASPYAMHGPNSHSSHSMSSMPGPGPGPVHTYGHDHGHAHGYPPGPGPTPPYYDSYGGSNGVAGVNSGSGAHYAGAGAGHMAGSPPANGNHENGPVSKMYHGGNGNGNVDGSSSSGYPMTAHTPVTTSMSNASGSGNGNNNSSMVGQKRSIDEAMGEASTQDESTSRPINGSQEGHLQGDGEKDMGADASKVLPVTPNANVENNEGTTTTKGSGEEVRRGSLVSDSITNTTKDSHTVSGGTGSIPCTPAAPVQMLSGSTPMNSQETPPSGNTIDANANATPINSNAHPPPYSAAGTSYGINRGSSVPMSSPEMYDPYYSGGPGMAPNAHVAGYGHGAAPHWQHGGTPTHPHPGYPGPNPAGQPPTPHGPPPHGHGHALGPPPHPKPTMYYDGMSEMDANAQGLQHGMTAPPDYDRNMYYNPYGAAPGSAPHGHHGPPTRANGQVGHGHGHPLTPYGAAQTMEPTHNKPYVTPESRLHGNQQLQGMGSPQAERVPPAGGNFEEGEYTKLLRSSGERLTDRKKLQNKAWYDRFEELKVYKQEHGDCLVPQKYSPNPR